MGSLSAVRNYSRPLLEGYSMTESDFELSDMDEELKRNLELADQQLKDICNELEAQELDELKAWANEMYEQRKLNQEEAE